MSGVVNPGFNANEEFGEKLPDDSQYEEIDLSGKTSSHDLPDINERGRSEAVEDSANERCGWCFLKPQFLQKFRTAKWALFWLCWAGALQGMVVNGFVYVAITTIERRFSLRSSQSGLIAGGYDIASFVCLIPVTYLGGRAAASKPRWLGWGVLVMGLGSLVFAVPHFAVGSYRATHQANVCNITSSPEKSLVCGVDQESNGESVSVFMWVFLLGQLLHGAGAAPLYTLGVTFIDDNVTKKMSSVYLGIYYTMAIIGPAIGYVAGAELLQIYTDAFYIDSTELGLTPNSKVWVGAWWIGFLVAGVVGVILAIPLLAFPPALPGAAAIKAEKVSEAHGGVRSERFGKLKELPRAFRNLIVNPTFFFLNMAGASEGLLIAGFAAFLPKLMENQFSLNPSWAAFIVGLITVPAGGGGMFLGGYLVKQLNLHCAGIIKLCIASAVCGAIFSTCFFLYCPNHEFAGLTAPYTNSSNVSLDDSCNANCGCNLEDYNPVCGVDDVMYFSPCYAGCKEEILLHDSMLYNNCSCIKAPSNSRSLHNDPVHYQAINQTCSTRCIYMWLFVVLCFLVMFFTFLGSMPALSATLRCVQENQRSFALGIQWIKVRLLGTIPSPMLFGALIDKTCVLWQESCNDNGACLIYENAYMGRYMLALAFIGKAASILFFFLAWWFYIPPSGMREALQAGTPTSPEGMEGESNSVPPILMNGHTHHPQEVSR